MSQKRTLRIQIRGFRSGVIVYSSIGDSRVWRHSWWHRLMIIIHNSIACIIFVARSLVLVTSYVIRGRLAGCGLALWHILTLGRRHVGKMWRVWIIISAFHPLFSILLVIVLVIGLSCCSDRIRVIWKPLGLGDVYMMRLVRVAVMSSWWAPGLIKMWRLLLLLLEVSRLLLMWHLLCLMLVWRVGSAFRCPVMLGCWILTCLLNGGMNLEWCWLVILH